MAQKQFTTYEADVTSFELREAMLGILRPGRYVGYNKIEANGSPSTDIPITLSHDSTSYKNIKKASEATPPTLGSAIGVAVSTQGGLIHEDQDINLNISFLSQTGYVRYDVIYMEHEYIQSAGLNPATYGVKEGTPIETSAELSTGIPTLDNPEKQSPIGIVKVPDGASVVGDLTYIPYPVWIGDADLTEKLFGLYFPDLPDNILNNIIGDMDFSSSVTWLDETKSITENLEAIDLGAKTAIDSNASDISTLQSDLSNLKLDDLQAPDDNTDLNASITAHGLFPKLSDEADEFLNGKGVWKDILDYANRIDFLVSTTIAFDKTDISATGSNSGTLDLSTFVSTGTKAVLVEVELQFNTNLQQFILKNPDDSTSYSVMKNAGLTGTDAYLTHFRIINLNSSYEMGWIGTLSSIDSVTIRIIGEIH